MICMETGALLRLSNREEIPAMTDSSTRDRAEGMFDEGKGNLKQGVGDLTGNERMKGEGMLDEVDEGMANRPRNAGPGAPAGPGPTGAGNVGLH